MADRQYGRGQQNGSDRIRRHRHRDVLAQQAFPLSGSDAADERPRQYRATPPLEEPPFYDTHAVSSRRNRSHIPDYTTYGVDGSITSSPRDHTNGYAYHSERYSTSPLSTQHDDEIFPPPGSESLIYGAGAWMADPFHGGRPQPTYGHNGLYHHTDQSRRVDMLRQPIEQRSRDQQPGGPASRLNSGSEHSWSDDLPPQPHRTEIYSALTDARYNRRDYQEEPEYHETHEYDEHRDRRRRRYREDYVSEAERYHPHRPRGSR